MYVLVFYIYEASPVGMKTNDLSCTVVAFVFLYLRALYKVLPVYKTKPNITLPSL